MTKDEKVIYYLDLASMPEYLPFNTRHIMEELGISDGDIYNYRRKMESELSLRPVEKRNIVVKQVIKPLLKKYGFSTGGFDWHREIEDSYIIIHMMNSQFNSIAMGVSFRFHISASKKNEIREKLSDQWIYNQSCDLKQFDFLPYCGMLSPYYAGDMYKIDGYKNYLSSDTPVEDICRQIKEDFGDYILPELCAVKSYEDFLELRNQKLKRYEEKEVRLLRYYYAAQSCALQRTESSYNMLVEFRKDLALSAEDIASHIEWMDVCGENASFTKIDAKGLAIKASKDGRIKNCEDNSEAGGETYEKKSNGCNSVER